MTLDLTKWNSGTAGSPLTDPNLNPAAVMNDHRKDWPSSGELYLQADNASLMLIPPEADTLDIYFEEDDDERHKHQIDEKGTEINAIGSRIGSVDVLQVWKGLNLFGYFGTFGENQEFYDWGLTREIIIGFPSLAGSVDTTTNVFVPYAWAGPAGRDGLDLAEILWSWTKFHTGLLADGFLGDALLHQPSFSNYSTRMEDWRYRQRFKVFRKIKDIVVENIVELSKASNAYYGWGAPVGAINPTVLRIHDFRDIPENTRILRFDHDHTEENPFGITRPKVRSKDQNIVNDRLITWGTIVQVSAGAPPLTADLGDPPNTPDEENRIHMSDASSIVDFGIRSVAESSPWVIDGNSAVGGARITDFHREDDEITFHQGPLHMDYWPGEIIHVRDVLQGLDGTENLFVDSKDYDLDRATANVIASRLEPARFELDPETLSDLTRVFAYYRADKSVTASGGRALGWNDQIGINHLGAHPSIQGPKILTAYQNGLDVLHFDGDNIGAGGGGVLDMVIGPFTNRMNLTVMALMEVDNASKLNHVLMGSEGRLATGSVEWLVHCGDSGSGTPLGMGWGWAAGNLQNDGPVLPTTGWVVAIWQPWTIKANWAIHNGFRGFAKWIDMTNATTKLVNHHVDSGYDGAPLAFRDDRLDWDRDTVIGADRTGASKLRARLAELLIFQHEATSSSGTEGLREGPVLPHEFEGIINFWETRWAL